MNNNEKFVSIMEAAEITNVSPMRIEALIRRERIDGWIIEGSKEIVGKVAIADLKKIS